MQSDAQTEPLVAGSLYTSCVEPTAIVAAQRSPDDGIEGSSYTSRVELTVNLNGCAGIVVNGLLYTSYVEPTVKVEARSCTPSLHASCVLAP